jgi:erythronate-4-phosphate dehydrogenase
MKRVVCCLDPSIPFLAEALQSSTRLYCVPGTELRRELLQQLRCQALFVRAHTRVDAALVEGTAVRFIGTPSSGIDHIAVEELEALGITVAHTPGCNANAVAEYVVTALLLWNSLRGPSLSGKRLGIIGFGHIGRRVGCYARKLGLEVYVYDPPLVRQGFAFPEWVHCVPSLSELCSLCHALTVHVPLTHSGPDATWHLLGIEQLSRLPLGSLVVQTSRGGVVEEAALEALVQAKHLFLALDVWEHEPSVNWHLADSALLATPHIAGYSWQARIACSRTLAVRFAEWAGIPLSLSVFEKALEFAPPPAAEIPWENPSALLSLLLRRRKFDEDSRILRSWRRLLPEQQKSAFRAYRESYPRRHETLNLPGSSTAPCW